MINKICNESFVRPAKKHSRVKWKGSILLFVLFILSILFAQTVSRKEEKIELKKCHSDIKPSMREILFSEYFRQQGSPYPSEMAKAVLATRRPRLMASIAVRESGGDPKAVGDGGKSRGAFQVQSRHWGIVSKDAVEQALQSERVLGDLLVECDGNLKKALNRYNGDTKKRTYSKNILKELENIPRLEN